MQSVQGQLFLGYVAFFHINLVTIQIERNDSVSNGPWFGRKACFEMQFLAK